MTTTTERANFLELARQRRSIRYYDAAPVEVDTLARILEAANAAPSAGDLQSYEIVCVESADSRRALAEAAHDQAHVAEAPLVLAFCADPDRAREKYRDRAELFCIQDATIACAYAQLAATELGLGSCWVGTFDEERAARTLQLPAGVRVIALLTVGRAAETPEATPRRLISDLARRDTFDGV